jgi:cell division protein FtsW (lipid II flippase)
MSTNKQEWIQNGIIIVFFVVAAVLFLTGNAKISLIVIMIGVVILGFFLVSQKRKKDKSAGTLDQRDVAQFKKSFSEKATGELKTIYAKRVTDEYQDEAIEAARQILVERRELT